MVSPVAIAMSVAPVAGSGHSGLLPGQRRVMASTNTGPLPARHFATASPIAAKAAAASAPSIRTVGMLTERGMLPRSVQACTSVG